MQPDDIADRTSYREMENIMRLFALLAIAVGLCYAQRTDGSFERTLNVTGFADLELTTDAGGIYVVPGPPRHNSDSRDSQGGRQLVPAPRGRGEPHPGTGSASA